MSTEEGGATVGSAPRQVDDQVAALTDALESVYAELDTGARTERFLHEVCRAAVAEVPGADMAGITVLHEDGVARTRTATDELMVTIDQVQYDVGEGPCLEAARTQAMTRAGVEDATVRWPVFAARAREFGIRSFLSAPILLDEQSLGSLNLYSRDGHGFGHTDQAVLHLLVVAVRYALEGVTRLTAAHIYGQQLERALASRAPIEQAKGVVRAARNVSADQAFEFAGSGVDAPQCQTSGSRRGDACRSAPPGDGRSHRLLLLNRNGLSASGDPEHQCTWRPSTRRRPSARNTSDVQRFRKPAHRFERSTALGPVDGHCGRVPSPPCSIC
jgi:hypothetical protein